MRTTVLLLGLCAACAPATWAQPSTEPPGPAADPEYLQSLNDYLAQNGRIDIIDADDLFHMILFRDVETGGEGDFVIPDASGEGFQQWTLAVLLPCEATAFGSPGYCQVELSAVDTVWADSPDEVVPDNVVVTYGGDGVFTWDGTNVATATGSWWGVWNECVALGPHWRLCITVLKRSDGSGYIELCLDRKTTNGWRRVHRWRTPEFAGSTPQPATDGGSTALDQAELIRVLSQVSAYLVEEMGPEWGRRFDDLLRERAMTELLGAGSLN